MNVLSFYRLFFNDLASAPDKDIVWGWSIHKARGYRSKFSRPFDSFCIFALHLLSEEYLIRTIQCGWMFLAQYHLPNFRDSQIQSFSLMQSSSFPAYQARKLSRILQLHNAEEALRSSSGHPLFLQLQ